MSNLKFIFNTVLNIFVYCIVYITNIVRNRRISVVYLKRQYLEWLFLTEIKIRIYSTRRQNVPNDIMDCIMHLVVCTLGTQYDTDATSWYDFSQLGFFIFF